MHIKDPLLQLCIVAFDVFNLLAANLHNGNAHDLTSSLGLIGNSFRLPGKTRFLQTDNQFWKKSGFNILRHYSELSDKQYADHIQFKF